MTKPYRIAAMGDLQFEDNKEYQLKEAFENINKLSPDLIIFLGDYGKGCDLGTGKGMEDVRQYLDIFDGKTVIPMIGNHDLQLESGKNMLPHGTTSRHFESAFGHTAENKFIEYENFRIFTINVDAQSENDCYTTQECYVSDENYNVLKKKICERPGVPVILFTHAPPICSGLQTVPEVHVRATNAFLDQNHNPYRWIDFNKKYNEVVMWFSGHYHIGHDYKRSLSVSNGTVFFTTGVCTSYSRDGKRQSRIIDICDRQVTVKTFDHNINELNCENDWYINDIQQLVNNKLNYIESASDIFSTGCGQVVKMAFGKNGRLYSMTDNGYLWEINVLCREAVGTLHYSNTQKLCDFHVSNDGIICVLSGKGYLHLYDDKNRFVREYEDVNLYQCVGDYEYEENTVKITEKYGYNITAWCRADNGDIYAALDSAGKANTFYIVL